MNNKALIEAYRKGYEAGCKRSDAVVDGDYKMIVSAFTVALVKAGMDADQVGEVINTTNEWLAERNGLSADAIMIDAEEETGFTLHEVKA